MRKLFHAAALCAALAAPAALAQPVPADGQVTKVDAAAGRITLKHGPIKNLDMDAMTMVFRVKDPAMLQAVTAGDRVRFEAERVDGAITITKMEKVK
jgi:Cu(I)/Ag(I) efflux system protein CusF